MDKNKSIGNMQMIKSIEKILLKCKKVNHFDTKNEKEAEVLSYSFIELRESFKRIVDELFPLLLSDKLVEEEIYEVLIEIGEEFRHIIYHIKDPKFYSYLF